MLFSRSELGREVFQAVFVHLGVNLFFQDFLGAGDGELDDFLAQLFTRTVGFLFDFGIGAGNNAFRFDTGITLLFIDNFTRALLRKRDDFSRLSLGILDSTGRFFLGQFLFVLATFGRCQTIGDLLSAFGQCIYDRRPDEFEAEPDKHRKRDRLPDER